ncbi:MAG: hypothetical protein AAGL17_20790 [Cyanobacteria bacterium J06576_12]
MESSHDAFWINLSGFYRTFGEAEFPLGAMTESLKQLGQLSDRTCFL